jgi:hypothetical protein
MITRYNCPIVWLQISADENQSVQGRIYIINSIHLMLPNCLYEHCVIDVNVKE